MSHHHGSGQPQQPTPAELNQQLQGETGAYNQFQGAQDAQHVADETQAMFDGLFGGNFVSEVTDTARVALDQAPVATGGGAGYKFSPEQIEKQLQQCDTLIHGLTFEDLPNAQKVKEVTSPAEDGSSTGQAKAVSDMGGRLVQRIQNQIQFVQNWQGQLMKVRQNYLDQEGHSEATWKAMTNGLFEGS